MWGAEENACERGVGGSLHWSRVRLAAVSLFFAVNMHVCVAVIRGCSVGVKIVPWLPTSRFAMAGRDGTFAISSLGVDKFAGFFDCLRPYLVCCHFGGHF